MINKILTELVEYALRLERIDRLSDIPSDDDLIETAIANATGQIEAQQRERVEKLMNLCKERPLVVEEMVKATVDTINSPKRNRDFIRAQKRRGEIDKEIEAALKELEPTDA